MLEGDVEELLALYLHQCSVQVTCAQLAVMGATCGMYDAAGSGPYEVGVPAKSGVSGGILAVVPGKPGIGVFSPGLNVYGNSVRGWEADTWCMRWFLVVPLVWVG